MALELSDYRDALRNFLKDFSPLNRLIEFQQESTDDLLDLYLNMAESFLNSIPPYLAPFSIGTFPIPNLIIHQAAIECLISNSIVQARNELTYNNGGITVKIPDGNRYMNVLQLLYRVTDQEINSLKNLKIAMNIAGGYGGVSSPYSYLHGRSAILNPNSILSG